MDEDIPQWAHNLINKSSQRLKETMASPNKSSSPKHSISHKMTLGTRHLNQKKSLLHIMAKIFYKYSWDIHELCFKYVFLLPALNHKQLPFLISYYLLMPSSSKFKFRHLTNSLFPRRPTRKTPLYQLPALNQSKYEFLRRNSLSVVPPSTNCVFIKYRSSSRNSS